MADLTITAANVGVQDANTYPSVQVGEAVTQGQPAYQDATDRKYYQSIASDTEAKADAVGIFITPASADGHSVLARKGARINLGTTLTVGTLYVVSANKGRIAPVSDLASGNWVKVLGIATAADTLFLDGTNSLVEVP